MKRAAFALAAVALTGCGGGPSDDGARFAAAEMRDGRGPAAGRDDIADALGRTPVQSLAPGVNVYVHGVPHCGNSKFIGCASHPVAVCFDDGEPVAYGLLHPGSPQTATEAREACATGRP